MASLGVFKDLENGQTETVGGGATLAFSPPTQISTLNTGVQSGNLINSYQTIAANSTGTLASGTPITVGSGGVVAVSSAGSAYSVTLPPSVPGTSISVVTITGVNTVAVFPNVSGDKINALSAGAGITMAALSSADFVCVAAGQWWTNPRVPS